MSRRSIFAATPTTTFRTKALTRLFDLLLVGGYIACGFLTYFLFLSGSAANETPRRPTDAQLLAAAGAPVDSTPLGVAATPAPSATPTPGAEIVATPIPVPTPPPAPAASADKELLQAMEAYVKALNDGEAAKARGMRADPNVPLLEEMKKVKAVELLAATPYPRIHRDKGSIWVHLKIDKAGKIVAFKGRVDWELRDDRWVTTNWDSKAAAPE
jgi:hypothetical protein